MSDSNPIPHEEGMDHTLSLVREGYQYILNRRRSFHSDIFETRLLGKKVICLGGKEAAELFYDNDKFQRKNAAPNRIVQTLFGEGGVQGLDGEAHRHRKAMFMSLMSPERLQNLTDICVKQWDAAVDKWSRMDEVVLYEEVKELLCRTACQWAGVPMPAAEEKVKELAVDLGALFESPAAMGPKHWAGRNARNRLEAWLGGIIEEVRSGKMAAPEHTALHQFALQHDLGGKLMNPQVAAVEILNILRPIVAIAIYINFLALAVHHYPEESKKLGSRDGKYAEMFIQEVRRFFPFFPMVGAIVKKDFTWKGYQFNEGTLTFLDLYGTNHDPELWENPEVFNPDRFAGKDESRYDLIPQGGGDSLTGHRCAGEYVTLEVMKVSLGYLANQLVYHIPADQDLSFSMVTIPSIPHSKVVLKNVVRR